MNKIKRYQAVRLRKKNLIDLEFKIYRGVSRTPTNNLDGAHRDKNLEL